MVKDLSFRVELAELFSDYNTALDDRNLARWLSFFTEECSYVVTTKENIDRGWSITLMGCETRGMMIDRVAAIENTMYFLPRQQRRIASGIRIMGAEGESMRVQSSFAIFETLPSEATKILGTGQMFDIVGYEDEQLRFLSRRCVLDSSIVPNSLVYPI